MGKKTEEEMRRDLFIYARRVGAEEDLRNLFHKWDTAIALAPPSERVEMSRMAILAVQELLDIGKYETDGLTINDEIVVAPRGKNENN